MRKAWYDRYAMGIFGLFAAIFCLSVAGSIGYRVLYTPLDYRIDSYYPPMRWKEYLISQEGTSELWGNSRFLGAFPYDTGGTVIYKFTYPRPLQTVRIFDQHSQWADGDVVKMWTSLDAETWTLRYNDTIRYQLVDYTAIFEDEFRGYSQFFLKYELYAGDQSRPPDDNYGASVRKFRVQATLQGAWLLRAWNGIREILLPALAACSLIFFVRASVPCTTFDLSVLLAIMGLALAGRIGFLTTVQHVPVLGDAYYYNIQAIDIVSFVTHPRIYLTQGMFVNLLKSLYAKGPIHILSLAFTYLIYGEEQFQTVRLLQGLLDTLSCGLAYALGCLLQNRRTGLLAAFLYAIYVPFWVATDRMLQETLVLFLLMLTIVLFLKMASERSTWSAAWAGIALGITVLGRQAFNYLVGPLLLLSLLIFLWKRQQRQSALHRYAWLCGGVAMTLGPWLILSIVLFQKPLLSYSVTYYHSFYKSITNQGWQPGHIHIEDGSILDQVTRDNQHPIPTYDDFREAFIKIVKRSPLVFVSKGLNNLYYYWKYPYNDFLQQFFVPLTFQFTYHRILGLFALWGMVLALPNWKKSFLLLLPIVNSVAIAMVSVIEIRHALPAFPFLLVLAAYMVIVISERIRELWKLPRLRIGRLLIMGGGGIVGCSIAFLLNEPTLLAIFPRLAPDYAHSLRLLMLTMGWSMLAGIVGILFSYAQHPSRSLKTTLFTAYAPLIVILLIMFAHNGFNEEWREWKVRLTDPTMRIRQEFSLPETLPEFSEAYLEVDMQGGSGHYYVLVVSVNGQEIRRYEHGILPDSETEEYFNLAYGGVYQTYLEIQGRTNRDLRQWFTIPINPAFIRQSGKLTVELSLESGGAGPHHVDIYGDYVSLEKSAPQTLPAFGVGTNKNSLYKYIVDTDFRLWTSSEVKASTTPITRMGIEMNISRDSDSDIVRWQPASEPASISSKFFDGTDYTVQDLSPEKGRQTGQYRIKLLLKTEPEIFFVY